MTMNVRGLFNSHWDLRHTIATHSPGVLVLTETKLTQIKQAPNLDGKPPERVQMVVRLPQVRVTIICVRDSVAVATNCTSVLLNSDGRIDSVVLRGSDTDLLLIGTYWPSGSSDDALACRTEMQGQIESHELTQQLHPPYSL